jgi:ketosteroid isomerase-like protein
MRLGDLGWTFLSGSMVSTHGDETLTVEVFVTNIYRREEDGWKLMHHHAAPGPHQPAYLEQRLN